jgi:hypothetical protein
MPRFNRKDSLDLKNARAVLRNPNADAEEKASAERTITRLNTERKRRIAAKRSAGTEPKPDDFETPEQYQSALREWWTKLDKLTAEKEAHKILSDPNASTYLRQKAYEKLGITQEVDESDREEQSAKKNKADRGPMREDYGFRSGHDWPEFVASGKEAQFQAALEKWRETAPPPSDPAVRRFLESLSGESKQ